jgi:hypothetical protein
MAKFHFPKYNQTIESATIEGAEEILKTYVKNGTAVVDPAYVEPTVTQPIDEPQTPEEEAAEPKKGKKQESNIE